MITWVSRSLKMREETNKGDYVKMSVMLQLLYDLIHTHTTALFEYNFFFYLEEVE